LLLVWVLDVSIVVLVVAIPPVLPPAVVLGGLVVATEDVVVDIDVVVVDAEVETVPDVEPDEDKDVGALLDVEVEEEPFLPGLLMPNCVEY
jgi:hypothetical protein